MEDSETEGILHTEDYSRNTKVDLIMATMPGPEARGYFEPRRSRPSIVVVTRVPRKNIKCSTTNSQSNKQRRKRGSVPTIQSRE
jgi:hypothetical protein